MEPALFTQQLLRMTSQLLTAAAPFRAAPTNIFALGAHPRAFLGKSPS